MDSIHLSKLMDKVNTDSFNSEQLTLINDYENFSDKASKYLMIISFSALIASISPSSIIESSIVWILCLMLYGGWVYWGVMKLNLVKNLKNIEKTKVKKVC